MDDGRDDQLIRFINRRQIACTLVGVWEGGGGYGHASGWCTPEQISDPSTCSPGVFKEIIEIRPIVRGTFGADARRLPEWYFDLIEAKGFVPSPGRIRKGNTANET
jgi:hypothetical protein